MVLRRSVPGVLLLLVGALLLGLAPASVAAPPPAVVTGTVSSVIDDRRLNGMRVELVVLSADASPGRVLASTTTSGSWQEPGGPGWFSLTYPAVVPPESHLRVVDPAGRYQMSYDWEGRSVPPPWEMGVTFRPSEVTLGMSASGRYLPLPPQRIYDSRTDDDRRPVDRGEHFLVELPWLPYPPQAVVVNVTTTRTSCTTYIADASMVVGRPWGSETSIVNARPGADVANLAVLKARYYPDAIVLPLYNHGCPTDVVVDLQGVYVDEAPGFGGYVPVAPERVLDTRTDTGPLGPRESVELPIRDLVADAPADATAVAVNVTATGGTAATSYLSAFAAGDDAGPRTSVLNAYRGADVANLAVVPLSEDGSIEVYNNAGSQHVVLDVLGWYTPSGGVSFWPREHRRTATAAAGPLSAGGTRTTTVPGRGIEVPAGATAVALNLTSTRATAATTYVAAYPAGKARPGTSNLNTRAGLDLANAAVVGLGPGWTLYNNAGQVRVLEDVQGFFAPGPYDPRP